MSFPRLSDGSSHNWADILMDSPNPIFSWHLALFGVAQDKGIPEANRLQFCLELLRRMADRSAEGARDALGMALRQARLKGHMLNFMLDVDKLFYQEERVVNERLDR